MPTFCDVKELTTSGAFPARIAAMILSSLIPPTTFTFTSAVFASYSDTTFLNSDSSRALQPTQMVRFVAAGFPALVGLADAKLAPIASAVSSTTAAATRFITSPPPVGTAANLLATFTRRLYDALTTEVKLDFSA